jgi:hypothetical protein
MESVTVGVRWLNLVLLCLSFFLSACFEVASESGPQVTAESKMIDESLSNYRRILTMCHENIPVASALMKQYPEAESSVSYYSTKGRQPLLRFSYSLYSRYVVNVTIPIKLNESLDKLLSWDQAAFYLYEVSAVELLDNQRYKVKSGELHKRFSEQEWRLLEDSEFDYTQIGIVLEKSSPVSNFEKAMERGL